MKMMSEPLYGARQLEISKQEGDLYNIGAIYLLGFDDQFRFLLQIKAKILKLQSMHEVLLVIFQIFDEAQIQTLYFLKVIAFPDLFNFNGPVYVIIM